MSDRERLEAEIQRKKREHEDRSHRLEVHRLEAQQQRETSIEQDRQKLTEVAKRLSEMCNDVTL